MDVEIISQMGPAMGPRLNRQSAKVWNYGRNNLCGSGLPIRRQRKAMRRDGDPKSNPEGGNIGHARQRPPYAFHFSGAPFHRRPRPLSETRVPGALPVGLLPKIFGLLCRLFLLVWRQTLLVSSNSLRKVGAQCMVGVT